MPAAGKSPCLSVKFNNPQACIITKSGMNIVPKTAVDSEVARSEFFKMVNEFRDSVKDADPQELEAALGEAVKTAKKSTAKRIKARK